MFAHKLSGICKYNKSCKIRFVPPAMACQHVNNDDFTNLSDAFNKLTENDKSETKEV